jgi:hypothetical protein
MAAKMMAVCFGACGFFAISIISFLRGSELLAALKKGAIGLLLLWIVGYFFGLMLTQIINDAHAHNR